MMMIYRINPNSETLNQWRDTFKIYTDSAKDPPRWLQQFTQLRSVEENAGASAFPTAHSLHSSPLARPSSQASL